MQDNVSYSFNDDSAAWDSTAVFWICILAVDLLILFFLDTCYTSTAVWIFLLIALTISMTTCGGTLLPVNMSRSVHVFAAAALMIIFISFLIPPQQNVTSGYVMCTSSN